MSEFRKIYYWANLIVNPIALVFLFSGDETLVYVTIGWVIVSGILDPRLRGLIIGFIRWLLTYIIYFACIGTMAAIVALVIFTAIASIAGLIGLVVALVYLWINALAAVLQDAR